MHIAVQTRDPQELEVRRLEPVDPSDGPATDSAATADR